MYVVIFNITDVDVVFEIYNIIAIVHTKVVNCNSAYKRCQVQKCIHKLSIEVIYTEVNNCNSALVGNVLCRLYILFTLPMQYLESTPLID